ncbi:MAG: hypothetical protein VX464_20705 [Pseudomonadota bacterium]|nr:hypothetical protein [Pseudomonadota bacterium]
MPDKLIAQDWFIRPGADLSDEDLDRERARFDAAIRDAQRITWFSDGPPQKYRKPFVVSSDATGGYFDPNTGEWRAGAFPGGGGSIGDGGSAI